MIEPSIKLILQDDSDVTNITDTRIYHTIKPQNITSACIVLQLISANRFHTFEESSGYIVGTIQLDCFGDSYQQAKTVADKVRLALDGYAGTKNSVEIDYVELDNERAIEITPEDGKQTPALYGVSLEFRFMNRETIPTF